MVWIGERNEQMLIERVCQQLGDDVASSNFTLVVPPGFGEDYVLLQLRNRLRQRHPQLVVAFVRCDGIRDEAGFFRELHSQWCPGASPQEFRNLSHVISACRKVGQRLVLLLSRFHRVLEKVGPGVLVDLRDAEQAGDLRSAVCCIYPLSWIKKEWRQRGHALLSSDYGDVHTVFQYEPLTKEEAFTKFKGQVRGELLAKMYDWVGGIPEYLFALIQHWKAAQPYPDSKIEAELKIRAFEKSDGIVRQLDETNESRFLDVIVDLWLPPGDPSSASRLRAHPWHRFLLNDSELAAEVVGEKCFSVKTQRLLEEKAVDSQLETRLQFAHEAYRKRRYRQSVEISERLWHLDKTPETESLRLHSSIMSLLFEDGTDVRWSKVCEAVDLAMERMPALVKQPRDRQRLADRYQTLRSLAELLIRKESVLQGNRRIVDVLAKDPEAAEATLSLLYLAFANASATQGNTESIVKALAIPEQIYRVWALWVLKLDFYCVPDGHNATWLRAAEVFLETEGTDLRIPLPGDTFSGFFVFAHFVIALIEASGQDVESAPIRNFGDLKKKSFIFQWRNDPAHSIVSFTRRNREDYLSIVEEWLACLCVVRPDGESSLDALRANLSPLPLLQAGNLVW